MYPVRIFMGRFAISLLGDMLFKEGAKIGMCEYNAGPSGKVPLPFNATLLFKALQYQLLVAVEYCHDLGPGECLWLEMFGDVTVPGKTQTEVKNYSDNLTDSHSNFWNTLKKLATRELRSHLIQKPGAINHAGVRSSKPA